MFRLGASDFKLVLRWYDGGPDKVVSKIRAIDPVANTVEFGEVVGGRLAIELADLSIRYRCTPRQIATARHLSICGPFLIAQQVSKGNGDSCMLEAKASVVNCQRRFLSGFPDAVSLTFRLCW